MAPNLDAQCASIVGHQVAKRRVGLVHPFTAEVLLAPGRHEGQERLLHRQGIDRRRLLETRAAQEHPPHHRKTANHFGQKYLIAGQRRGFGVGFGLPMKHVTLAMVLVSLTAASNSYAQDEDDLLSPIAVPKPKAKPKPKPVKAKPAPSDSDLLAPLTPPAQPTGTGAVLVRAPAGVPDATVTIDGKDVGFGRPSAIEAGERVVVVKRPGFQTFTRRVQVGVGKTVDVTPVLPATAAVVSVSTDVSRALVFINGRPMGTAPVKDVEVAPGQVEVTVRREGYREDRQVLSMAAGRDYALSVTMTPLGPVATTDRPVEAPVLTPSPITNSDPVAEVVTHSTAEPTPITQRWYFWVAVGVAVVAAAAVTAKVVSDQASPQLTEERAYRAHYDANCVISAGVACATAPVSFTKP